MAAKEFKTFGSDDVFSKRKGNLSAYEAYWKMTPQEYKELQRDSSPDHLHKVNQYLNLHLSTAIAMGNQEKTFKGLMLGVVPLMSSKDSLLCESLKPRRGPVFWAIHQHDQWLADKLIRRAAAPYQEALKMDAYLGGIAAWALSDQKKEWQAWLRDWRPEQLRVEDAELMLQFSARKSAMEECRHWVKQLKLSLPPRALANVLCQCVMHVPQKNKAFLDEVIEQSKGATLKRQQHVLKEAVLNNDQDVLRSCVTHQWAGLKGIYQTVAEGLLGLWYENPLSPPSSKNEYNLQTLSFLKLLKQMLDEEPSQPFHWNSDLVADMLVFRQKDVWEWWSALPDVQHEEQQLCVAEALLAKLCSGRFSTISGCWPQLSLRQQELFFKAWDQKNQEQEQEFKNNPPEKVEAMQLFLAQRRAEMERGFMKASFVAQPLQGSSRVLRL